MGKIILKAIELKRNGDKVLLVGDNIPRVGDKVCQRGDNPFWHGKGA